MESLLMKASYQWRTRPADERFWNVQELHAAVTAYKEQAVTDVKPYALLDAVADGDEVLLHNTQSDNRAKLTHWAFGQLSARANFPASALRRLPAKLATDVINHGLRENQDGNDAHLLFHQNGEIVCRAMMSDIYDRIWNADVTKFLLTLSEKGWRNPPAWSNDPKDPRRRKATEADLMKASIISVGDMIAPAGLYASDHDMFAFLVDTSRTIDDGSEGGLHRGFLTWNSEVGSSSWGMECFLFRTVCGNHMIWNAQNIATIRMRHVGNASTRFGRDILNTAIRYANASPQAEELRIKAARNKMLGKDREEVLEKVFGMRLSGVSQSNLTNAYTVGTEHVDTDGDPRTVYGFTNALTRYSQRIPYADERVSLDRASAKLMALAA